MKPKRMQQMECACGRMPASAPLANPYVPYQLENPPKYEARRGLIRGTLFPGLDLPFQGRVNTKEFNTTPMTELQTLNFAIQELQLYLDTHENDADAFAAYKGFLKLSKEAHRRYVELYGPICRKDMADCPRFSWLDGAWPWELRGEKE